MPRMNRGMTSGFAPQPILVRKRNLKIYPKKNKADLNQE